MVPLFWDLDLIRDGIWT